MLNTWPALHCRLHRQRSIKVDSLDNCAVLAFTIDLLGESTITEAEADGVQKQYLDLIAGLSKEINPWTEIPLIDRDERGPIRASMSR